MVEFENFDNKNRVRFVGVSFRGIGEYDKC